MKKRMKTYMYICSDLMRYYGKCDVIMLLKAYFTNSTF